VLDATMKRHWLQLLPLLSPREAQRLRDTLQVAVECSGAMQDDGANL
jgi:hypothetical protein